MRSIAPFAVSAAARADKASMGTSPDVLANAVLALAHQKKPIVPDEMILLNINQNK